MRDRVVVPERIQEKLNAMPEFHGGIHRVTVELSDGRVFPGVEIAWATEVIRVPPHAEIPFTGVEVVDAWITP